MPEVLRIYRLSGAAYERQDERWFPELRLGMTLWEGEFEGVRGVRSTWLRWLDEQGELIPTGREQRERAERQHERAEQERERAERRAERLAALLRRSGIDPGFIEHVVRVPDGSCGSCRGLPAAEAMLSSEADGHARHGRRQA